MPRVTQEYRDARRSQILDAARRCFVRQGVHPTSMQDLFTEAGLSSGAVYRYFASKNELIIAIVKENLEGLVTMIRESGQRHDQRTVGDILADVYDLVHDQHSGQNVAPLAVFAWGEAVRDPTLAAYFRDVLIRIRSELAVVVAEQQQRGAMSTAVTAEQIAGLVLSTVQGYTLHLSVLGEDAVSAYPDSARALFG